MHTLVHTYQFPSSPWASTLDNYEVSALWSRVCWTSVCNNKRTNKWSHHTPLSHKAYFWWRSYLLAKWKWDNKAAILSVNQLHMQSVETLTSVVATLSCVSAVMKSAEPPSSQLVLLTDSTTSFVTLKTSMPWRSPRSRQWRRCSVSWTPTTLPPDANVSNTNTVPMSNKHQSSHTSISEMQALWVTIKMSQVLVVFTDDLCPHHVVTMFFNSYNR